MELGKLGVFCFTDVLTPDQIVELVQHAEKQGYGTFWYPEAVGYESFSLGSFLLNHTESMIIASGIANIYARDATAAKQGQHTLSKISGGRFILGLGVSHIPLVEDARGHVYEKPLSKMRSYLDAMENVAIATEVDEPPPTVLAALGPKMMALAAEHTSGAMSYSVTPEHTAQAKEILGPDTWLCVEQKVLMTKDAATAREIARQAMDFYMLLPNYRNNWQSLGFSEDDLSNGGSDRFLDAMVVWGDETAIRQRVKEHFDAGSDHVCIQALNPEGIPMPDMNALTAFAP